MLKEQYELVLKQLTSDAQRLSRQFPELAVNLGRDNTDPDVARLIEGVALIAARQRELLEQDQAEQMQGWLQAVAPEILQPIPAMVYAEIESPVELTVVTMGSEFTAQLGEQAVHWQSAVTTQLLPWHLEKITQQPRELTLALVTTGAFSPEALSLDIHFVGDRSECLERLVSLKKSCQSITILVDEQPFSVPASALQLKYQVSDGSWLQLLDDRFDSPMSPRWLTECWCYPNRTLILSLDLAILDGVAFNEGSRCNIEFQLNKTLGVNVERAQFAVNVLPLVNLKQAEMLPFARQSHRSLYELALLDESQTMDQLVSIVQVNETVGSESFPYFSLNDLALRTQNDGAYQLIKQESVPTVQIRLDRDDEEVGLMQIRAYIHQGDLASNLTMNTSVTGHSLQGRLLSRPSAWVPAPTQQQAQWQALQVQQVATKRLDLEAIKSQLQVLMPSKETHFDEHRRTQRWIDALVGMQLKDSPITRGTSLILGQEISITLNTTAFGEADIWLFSTMLWQWLRARLAVNSVLAMRTLNEKGESILYWPHASGTRAVV